MKKEKRGFYIFCVVVCVVCVVAIWGLVEMMGGTEPEPASEPDVAPARVQLLEQASNRDEVKTTTVARPLHLRREMDDLLKVQSIAEGAEDTQGGGEHGSLEGAIFTDTLMVYEATNYRYLPHSPLIEFTDDMIRQSGENTYYIKKDAMQAQAQHIQEASIALSVSPRVEWEKTTGYRLVEIPENTLFSKLGMVSGDIIVSINGVIPDMEPMALMFVNMVAGKRGHSTVVVEHRGVKRTLELQAE